MHFPYFKHRFWAVVALGSGGGLGALVPCLIGVDVDGWMGKDVTFSLRTGTGVGQSPDGVGPGL